MDVTKEAAGSQHKGDLDLADGEDVPLFPRVTIKFFQSPYLYDIDQWIAYVRVTAVIL
jgi:hypothetical protein